MSTNLEDRLTAALHARADLVQPEDLRPAEPPTSHRSLVRRPATWALAAAAAVAVAGLVVAPAVLGGGEDGETPEPAPALPTPNGDEVPGGDWPVAYTYPKAYDVDGDGVADAVVIRTQGDGELPSGVRRVEARLSTGGVTAVLLDYDTYDLTAIEPVQVDPDAGQEVLYYRGTDGGGDEIGVLDMVDGALVDLDVPSDPGITSEPDADFHARGWFVDDLALYSWRTVDGGFVPGGTNPTKPPYPVDLVRWTLVDGELTPTPEGPRCWNGGDGAAGFQPC